MLTLGYDAKRAFHNFTGLGAYSRQLLLGLADLSAGLRLRLYTPPFVPHPALEDLLNHPAVAVVTGPRRLASLWRARGFGRALRDDPPDLLHGLSNAVPPGLHGRLPVVMTVHDVIHRLFPRWYPWTDRQVYEAKLRAGLRHSAAIVAVSRHTADDLVRHYGVDPGRIHCIPPPLAAHFTPDIPASQLAAVRAAQHLPAEYLLYTGSITPRKNLLTLVQALALLPAGQRPPLVVAGRGGRYRAEVARYVARQGLESQVLWRPDVRDADLPAVYRMASLLIYPSLYEGFGLPVAEALACGTAVVTARGSSMEEAGGPGARYVEPADVGAMAAAIADLLGDSAGRQALAAQGQAHVRAYAREVVAARTLDLYRQVLGR
ncbi:MAG: glycosyltransferase family 1 protein [Bacteroidia bacterium]